MDSRENSNAQHTIPRTISDLVTPEAGNTENTITNPTCQGTDDDTSGNSETHFSMPGTDNARNGAALQQRIQCEQDQFISISNITRIMKDILPPNARISDDAKGAIQECVSEYISLVTQEANEKCHREHRKIITPEDILYGFKNLGFENYHDTLSLYLGRLREEELGHGSSNVQQMARHSMNLASPSFDSALSFFYSQEYMQPSKMSNFQEGQGGSSSAPSFPPNSTESRPNPGSKSSDH